MMKFHIPNLILLLASGVAAQAPPLPMLQQGTTASSITLEEAINRAQTANTAYSTAVADAGVAEAQRAIASSALLPGIVYHNQFLYTQGTSGVSPNSTSPTTVRFVANNAVHEYISQGVVTETLGGAALATLRSTTAQSLAARARLEVARRGLVLTVVGSFYGVPAAEAKVGVAQRALDEAGRFNTITQQREAGGEVAHADVVRGDLQYQQRQRDLNDARLNANRARLDLGVLLFPNPATPYQLAASLTQLPQIASQVEVYAAAAANNPDVKAALQALRAANLDVVAAKFAYVPELSVSFLYGIDAPQFAIHASDGTRNLGYSALATFDIPVFDWFATRGRVRQSTIRRDQAKVDLTVTQRQLLASLDEVYEEAQVSLNQLALLDKSVDSARDSLRLTNLRYTAGEGTVLEIVDAQNTLVSAETSRVDGAVRYFTALATLQTLTGKMP